MIKINFTSLCFALCIFLSVFLTGITSAALCYQETANASSPADTANCGLNYTGNYSADLNDAYLYVNYAKPNGALSSSNWKVKYGNHSEENRTIPIDCWNADANILTFKIKTDSFVLLPNYQAGSYTSLECKNITGWTKLDENLIVGDFFHFLTGDSQYAQCPSASTKEMYDGNWNSWAGSFKKEPYSRCWVPNYVRAQGSRVYEEAMIWDVNGVCINPCSANQVGARKCYSDSSYQTCEYNLSNGCYEWTNTVDCASGRNCVDGACMERIGCTQNSDCGTPVYGGNVCKFGDAFRSLTFPVCDNNICRGEALTYEFLQHCANGCSNGACNSSGDECEHDSDCNEDNGESCENGYCVAECEHNSDCDDDEKCDDGECVDKDDNSISKYTAYCGNGICDAIRGETSDNCASDCGSNTGLVDISKPVLINMIKDNSFLGISKLGWFWIILALLIIIILGVLVFFVF